MAQTVFLPRHRLFFFLIWPRRFSFRMPDYFLQVGERRWRWTFEAAAEERKGCMSPIEVETSHKMKLVHTSHRGNPRPPFTRATTFNVPQHARYTARLKARCAEDVPGFVLKNCSVSRSRRFFPATITKDKSLPFALPPTPSVTRTHTPTSECPRPHCHCCALHPFALDPHVPGRSRTAGWAAA